MKKGLAYPLFSFRNRVLIIVLGLVIGISSLLFTNDMARQLREKEQNEVAIGRPRSATWASIRAVRCSRR